jgi:hypothetical protein
MGGGLLVTHVDDANTFIEATIVNIDDMPAAQREDGIDTFGLEGLGNEVAAGNDVGITALLLERVVGSCSFGLVYRLQHYVHSLGHLV